MRSDSLFVLGRVAHTIPQHTVDMAQLQPLFNQLLSCYGLTAVSCVGSAVVFFSSNPNCPFVCHFYVHHVPLPICTPCTTTYLYTMYHYLSVHHVPHTICTPRTTPYLYTMYHTLSVRYVPHTICTPCTTPYLYTMYHTLSVHHVPHPICTHSHMHCNSVVLPGYL